MIWLKAAHILAIAVWSGTLICLPGLYVQRAHVPDEESLHRLQRMVRYIYVRIMSPAAFVAVATGIALIFVRETFEPWFSVKLVLVGALVAIHVLTGLVVIRLFDEGEVYPVWRFVAATGATVLVICGVLVVVLAKPEIPDLLPPAMAEPGALRELILGLIPYPRS